MNEVFLTGSSGFVGQNLNKYLQSSDYLVHVIRRGQVLKANNSSNAFVHLAGKAHDLKKTSNPQEYYDVNYELTKRLYDAFLKSNAKKFIFVSSVKAAADSVDSVLTEETNPNPQTDYGKSKLMAEQYIQSKALPEGKFYYILRPCMIHGPGNKGNLNLLYQLVKKGIPYPLAAFENRRSFLSIENLCYVIKELIEQEIPSGVYQVADDEALSTNDVVKILAQSSGKKPKLWSISKGLINLTARIGNTLSLPLNTEKLNKLTESYVVSNSKLKAALGKNLPVSAKDGLALTAASFASDIGA